MENNRMEQLEALKILSGVNERLVKNLPTLIDELSGQRQPDTDTYLKNVVDSINWEIMVINAASSLLSESSTQMDKEDFNAKMLALGSVLPSNDDRTIAAALQELIPCFELLGNIVREITD